MSDRTGTGAVCERCGEELETGFALLEPVVFPDERELYEDRALGATQVATCPQCPAPNGHLELVSTLLFAPRLQVFALLPPGLESIIGGTIREQMEGELGADWTVEVFGDAGEFARASLRPILALVDPTRQGELAPAGERDFAYHSALLTLTRPGMLTVLTAPEELSAEEILEMQVTARRYQIVTGFLEAFEDAEITELDPAAAVAELFPPECFDKQTIEWLRSEFGKRAADGQEVTSLWAALVAAAIRAEQPRVDGLMLARGLVRLALAGTDFKQAPSDWAELMSADDVFHAIRLEFKVDSPETHKRALGIAGVFGRRDEVGAMTSRRFAIPVDLESDLDGVLEGMLTAGEEGGHDDDVVGLALTAFARIEEIDVAFPTSLQIIERFVDSRPLLVVPIIEELAARLKNEGQAQRALDLLDGVEPRLTPHDLPPEVWSSLRNERGNALRELQRLEAALAAYREAVSLRPKGIDDVDVRVAMLNEARTLRDLGRLPAARKAFERVLPYTRGRERFDCLFAMTLGCQREADFVAAQELIDEAFHLIASAPVDDQITRFLIVAEHNARALDLPEPFSSFDLNELVEESENVTDRQSLLSLATSAGKVLGSDLDLELLDELLPNLVELVRGLDLVRYAAEDPEMAFTWLPVAHLVDEDQIAAEIVDALLVKELLPIMTMRVATIGTRMAVLEGDWDRTAELGGRAIEAATTITDLGSEGTTSLGVVETLAEVRALGAALALAPAGEREDALMSRLAETQCSLLLSVRFGEAKVDRGARQRAEVQALQWLDAGASQLPILSVGRGGGVNSRRGDPLDTAAAQGLGERVSGRLARSTALAEGDLIDGVDPYRAFRVEFGAAVAPLEIDTAKPLTLAPSAALVGIPLHHAMPDRAIAYAPSLSVAYELARRAEFRTPAVAAVAEVRCPCFDDSAAVVDGLVQGGEALAEICEQAPGIGYRSVGDLAATAAAANELMGEADIVKLSCHGVASATAGRFAVLLSDGRQLPPPLSDIATRDDLVERYLFDWSDLAAGVGKCRLVVSSACTSGSGLATRAGEYIGLARGYLVAGVLSFVAPLWPVAVGPAQEFANGFIERCLRAPDESIAISLRRTRLAMAHLPPRVADAFVLHGHAGPLFK